jgi:hypothetical protein
MNTNRISLRNKVGGVLIGVVMSLSSVGAQTASHSSRVIIERPETLPELARVPGVAFDLNLDAGNGGAYLYVEQENGKRLVVFDVTDPSRLRMVRVIQLPVAGPFDFGERVGDSAILIRFRDDQSEALLDVRKAKSPELKTLRGALYPDRIESLDSFTYLTRSEPALDVSKAPHDYRLIDASNPTDPTVLYIAKSVTDSTTRDETGTTFLLGASGLTIIRHPEMERAYETERAAN